MNSIFSNLLNNLTWPFRAMLSSPMALFSAPRKFLGLSLPVRLGVFTFLFLLICAVVAFFLFLSMQNHADWRQYLTIARVTSVVLFLILIPLAVYKLVRLWLEGDLSEFPDIDKAWKFGMQALESHGIDLNDVPLFLVTGTEDDKQARAAMQASELSFAVNGVPEGPAPIHWFGSPEAVFLLLTETTRVGRLAARFQKEGGTAASGRGSEFPTPAARPALFANTMNFDDMGGGGSAASSPMPPDTRDSSPAAPRPAFTGTIGVSEEPFQPALAAAKRGSLAAPAIIKLTDAEGRDIDRRLRYICERLRIARQPYCPANGILSFVPFSLIRAGEAQAIELRTAARQDLETLNAKLKLRCPVAAVVNGMESESGFRELARRIGRDAVKASRFGKGSDVWTPPRPEHVEAVARHACGAFEDWSYHLFGSPDGLAKPGNTKLYSLLCRIRTELQDRLTDALCYVYGREKQENDGSESMLFSGCYFAATGVEEDKQAFMKSVFEKMIEQEGELSWNVAAVQDNERYRFLANVANILNLLLIVTIVGLFLAAKTSLLDFLPLPGR